MESIDSIEVAGDRVKTGRAKRIKRSRTVRRPEILQPLSSKGYGRIAWVMAGTETKDLAIFRKFGELNMLNLLRLQSELLELQKELEIVMNSSQHVNYTYSFRQLRKHDHSSNFEDSHEPEPLDSDDSSYEPNLVHTLLKRIQKKLKIYSKYLQETRSSTKHPTKMEQMQHFCKSLSLSRWKPPQTRKTSRAFKFSFSDLGSKKARDLISSGELRDSLTTILWG